MKTTNLRHSTGNAGGALLSGIRKGMALSAALVLTAARLAAMPVVNTISGGPSAGYLDGDSFQAALYNTPVALALDKNSTLLFVADRGNNAIRQLDLAANQTITFATFGINVPVGVAVDKDGNVFVLNRGNGSNGTVVHYDVFGDYLGVVASCLINAQGIAMDDFGNIYVTVQNNTVVQIDSSGFQNIIAVVSVPNTLLRGITILDS